MFRIDDPTGVAVLPAPEAAGSERFFFDGDPVNNLPASIVRASFLNMVQEELRNVVLAGGLTPSKTTYNQVLTAIKKLVGTPSIWGKTSTGSANTQLLNPDAPVAQLVPGLNINFVSGFQNNGPVTVNISGLGAVQVKKIGPYGQMNFEGGEWQVNDLCTVVYDGSVFQWVDTQAYRQNGLGVVQTSGAWPAVDLNTKTISGFYAVAAGSPNAPLNDYGFLQVLAGGDVAWKQQIFYHLYSDRFFIRRFINNNAWTAWQEVATQGWANGAFATIAANAAVAAAAAAAQSTANTGVANAATADGKAVTAQSTADTALARAVKGWCNFDGRTAGTITPRANLNISSITKIGTGQYTANYSSAMNDANYAFIPSGSSDIGGTINCIAYPMGNIAPSTTSRRFNTANASGTLIDVPYVNIIVVGN